MMTKDYHINICYSREDGGYIADVPDLTACSAFGQTPEEALAEVQKAKAAWLKVYPARGQLQSGRTHGPSPAAPQATIRSPRDFALRFFCHCPALTGQIQGPCNNV